MYKIQFTKNAEKQFKKITSLDKKRIMIKLSEYILEASDPRENGKPLQGKLSGNWRYRVGKYRIICEIYDDQLLVLVVKIGTRGDVYK